MRRIVVILSLCLSAAACGKGARGSCPQRDVCGGNPAGNWAVNEVCQVPAVRPIQTADVNDFTTMLPPSPPTIAPPVANPVLLQQTTSGDWCSNLVYNPDDSVANANLWHEAPPLAMGSTILLASDGTYVTKLIFQIPDGDSSTHFARHCLIANGAPNPTCEKLAAGLTKLYAPLGAAPPTFGNIKCTDDPSDGGCNCTYAVTVVVDNQGYWAVDKNDPTILLQDSSVLTFNGAEILTQAPGATMRSSFCAPGGSLELSGERGGSLSNVQGLRTLGLSPM